MANGQDVVRIQGNQYDQGSTELKIGNVPIYGYASIDWDHKRERQKSITAGKDRRPKGRTGGKYTPGTLKMSVRRDTASQIKLLLAARVPDGQSYGDADDVPIVLQYVEDVSNQSPTTCEFNQCALVSDGGKSDDSSPDMVDLEWDFMFLDETIDGKKVTLYHSGG